MMDFRKIDLKGKDAADIKKWLELVAEVDEWMKGQPPADDLDAVAMFLEQLNSYYATLGQYEGEADTLFNRCILAALTSEKGLGPGTVKVVKNSSTLTMAAAAGLVPQAYGAFSKVREMKNALMQAANNYRTLLACFREAERLKYSVKNTFDGKQQTTPTMQRGFIH